MFSPSFEEVQEIAKNKEYKNIPIAYEMYSDIATSIEVLKILKGISNHCYMLESVEDSQKWGRYTFLGFNPILEFTCQDGVVQIKGDLEFKDSKKLANGEVTTIETDNPGEIIKDLIRQNKSPKFDNLPSFTGGFVGYFAYDYIKYSEPSLNLDAQNQDQFKDIDIMLFDKVIAFDNFRQKIVIIVNIKTDDLRNNYRNACRELSEIADLIKNGEKAKIQPLSLESDFKPVFSREQYGQMVMKAKEYIKEGDIFQVVLSNRIEADISGSLFDTYRVLRTTRWCIS